MPQGAGGIFVYREPILTKILLQENQNAGIHLIKRRLYAKRKTELLAAAAQIVECNRERQRLQKRKYKLTDPQKQVMERYEDIVQKDIGKLTEYESYQLKIKNDLRQLGGEKELLLQDKTDIIRRQHMLKTIGKALSIILVALGAMLLALVLCFKVDITVPFLATVVFAAAVAGLILNEARKNRIDMAIT